MLIKRLVLKLFPKLYISLAVLKRELYEDYIQLKQKNCCRTSFFNYFINYILYGATPLEYNLLGFETLSRKGKSYYVTMRRNRKIDRKYNHKLENEILWNKDKFNKHFAEFITRKWIYITNKTTEEDIKYFYKSLIEKKFIIKPNNLYYGKGIYIGTEISELYETRKMNGVIVEEIVRNDETIANLNPTSLNTFRVVTCIDKYQHPHIVTIVMRTGSKGAIIDNAKGGGSYYHIDMNTGIIDSPGRDSYGSHYITHPTSGILMPGFKITKFENLKQYALDIASRLPNARYVGWDIAITQTGFEVIEGNVCPSADLIQCNNVGLYNEILNYLRD